MPHLGFGVCSTSTERTRDAFRTWGEIRQHERLSATPEAQPLFVGVLLASPDDGVRDWDTTLVALDGDLRLDDEEVRQRQRVWPDRALPSDAAAGTAAPIDPARKAISTQEDRTVSPQPDSDDGPDYVR